MSHPMVYLSCSPFGVGGDVEKRVSRSQRCPWHSVFDIAMRLVSGSITFYFDIKHFENNGKEKWLKWFFEESSDGRVPLLLPAPTSPYKGEEGQRWGSRRWEEERWNGWSEGSLRHPHDWYWHWH